MLLPFTFLFVLKLSYGALILNNKDRIVSSSNADPKPINDGTIPIHFDWRDEKKVTPVKNQKNCNAGWAFSVIANIESMLKIHRGVDETLSEQHLIDCDKPQHGCRGYGNVVGAFATIVIGFAGVIREKEYPYENKQSKCRTATIKPHYISMPSFIQMIGDEEDMVQYLYKYGPLSVAINSKSMSSGKYVPKTIDQPSKEDCPPEDLDHAVLIVGYNVYVDNDKEVPYWIIKNSWGEGWGDQGYYYLERGRNACGITTQVAFADIS